MQLRYEVVALHPSYTWATARGASSHSLVVIVELRDGKTWGWGEAAPIRRYGESVDTVSAFLARVDASALSFADVDASQRYLDSLANGEHAAKGALDIALVDGAARQANVPVHRYFGLGFREGQHDTSFTIGIAEPEVIAQKVIAAERYPILKLKLGGENDRATLAALRSIAPKKTIRVDANEGFRSKEYALTMIEWLASDGAVEFVEQPLPAATSLEDLRWLKVRSPLPLIADESYHSAGDVAHCAACFHGVNVKLAKTGGLSRAVSALREARAQGLKTMLGCMIETSIGISAAAHLAELCDYLDLDGNVLIEDDPYRGVANENGVLSFDAAEERVGLRVRRR